MPNAAVEAYVKFGFARLTGIAAQLVFYRLPVLFDKLARSAPDDAHVVDRIERREAVLNEGADKSFDVRSDPNCLALLKHYRRLMPMAQDARKPMFHLKPAEGAIGAHFQAVRAVEQDFQASPAHERMMAVARWWRYHA